MQNPFLPFLFILLFIQDVFGADETVNEGDSVTLQTGVIGIQNDDVIMWMFGPKNMILCRITRKGDLTPISFIDAVGFRGRLQVDQNTGSLIVRNTRIRHSGLYKLTISSEQTLTKIFKVTVKSVVGKTDEVKSVSVKEGESVTLNTDVSEVQRDDLIVWRFGDKGILLAKIDVETNETSLNDADERFRDRLKLDHQTGSLTITNTRTEHAGLYELQIRGRESSRRFLLSVSDSGLSPGAVAGTVVGVLLLVFAAAGVFYYQHYCKISELLKQTFMTVLEGKSVNLKPYTEINKDDHIEMSFGPEDTLIAEIKGKYIKYNDNADGGFRDRLKLDKKTGSLTITNTRTTDTGLYKLKTRSGKRTSYKIFCIYVIERTPSVMEGESVNLNPDSEINKDDNILWIFEYDNKETRIAEITRETGEILTYDDAADERFRGRLKLDKKTGSLTITNTRNTDSGEYKLQIISNSGVSDKTFSVTVRDKVEVKSLKKEDSVTLQPDAEIQREDLFLWTFGVEDTLIAQIRGGTEEIIKYDDAADGRFRDRLKLDKKTGSLTITNTRTEHIGVYKLQTISGRGSSYKKFRVLMHKNRVNDSATEGLEDVAVVNEQEGSALLLKR